MNDAVGDARSGRQHTEWEAEDGERTFAHTVVGDNADDLSSAQHSGR